MVQISRRNIILLQQQQMEDNFQEVLMLNKEVRNLNGKYQTAHPILVNRIVRQSSLVIFTCIYVYSHDYYIKIIIA